MLKSAAESDVEVAVDKQAILSCEVLATPKPVWRWFLNGEPIEFDGAKYFIQFEKDDLLTTLIVFSFSYDF